MSEDKKIHRNRPQLIITIDAFLMNKIEELMLEKKMKKTELVELCISLGLTRFEQLYGKGGRELKGEAAQEARKSVEVGPPKSKGDQIAEAFSKATASSSKGWDSV